MNSSAMRGGGALIRLAVLALAAAALYAVFGEARSFGFLDYDDGEYVFRNRHLIEGGAVERLRWAFTSFHAANWHPLTWISFIADRALFGLDPEWYHLENLLLHGLNTLLALWLLVRLTGSPGKSALVAALFALHPLRVESVAWITERKGLLMAFFAMLTFHAHVSYTRRPAPARLLAVALLFAGALFSKPQAVALPLVLLVLDWWPLGRLGRRTAAVAGRGVVREKVPLLLLAAAVTAFTVAAQRRAGAMASLEGLAIGKRLAGAVIGPAAYLAKTLWPFGLTPEYPLLDPPFWQVAGAALTLAGLTVAAVRVRETQPWVAAGWLVFLLFLAPVSNLFQAGGQAMADRYTYLPHIALFFAAVWSGGRALRNHPCARNAAAAACVLLALASGWLASRQVGFWRDELTLFSRAVAVTRGNWKMHYNLGNTFERLGRDTDAEAQYGLALSVRPDYAEALNNLGAIRARHGDAETAADLFARAVRVRPEYGPGWFNLGFQSEQQGDLAAALRQYGRAAALQPDAAEPRVRLGRVLARLGRRDEAAASCRAALRLDPSSAGAAACLREVSR